MLKVAKVKNKIVVLVFQKRKMIRILNRRVLGKDCRTTKVSKIPCIMNKDLVLGIS